MFLILMLYLYFFLLNYVVLKDASTKICVRGTLKTAAWIWKEGNQVLILSQIIKNLIAQ